jgi:predicted N-acetyltransferase YhbS
LTTDDLIEVEQVFTHAFSVEEASAIYQIIGASISNNTPDSRLCLGYEKQINIVGAIAFTSVVFEPDED